VLDHHFDDISTEEIGAYEQYEGTPLMEHLRRFG